MVKNCVVCSREFEARDSRNIVCSAECRKEYRKEYDRKQALESYHRRKATDPEGFKARQDAYNKAYFKGVRLGYDQSGENNNAYKNGVGIYHTFVKDSCELCGSKQLLEVHHKNRNREDNSIENLTTLCKSCHKKEHMIHDPITGRFIGSK